MRRITDYFWGKPRALFLLDGLGAACTAFSLFFVVRHYADYFGMPPNILTYLSAIGLVYCAYSMSCYFLLKGRYAPYLRIIAIGNLLYCVLTMMLLFTHYNELTQIGLAYFVVEMLIIVSLVYIELKVATMLNAR